MVFCLVNYDIKTQKAIEIILLIKTHIHERTQRTIQKYL